MHFTTSSSMKCIRSVSHDLVKHWVRLQKDRAYRYETHTVLVEGKKLLQDLMKRYHPQRIMITEEQIQSLPKQTQDIIQISPAIASKISDVESSEGWFAEYAIPVSNMPKKVIRSLVLDGLQDPGNVGTLFRTALAFNILNIFLIEPCCDPWNPKALRAAKGAQFDLTIVSCTWEQLRSYGSLIVADVHGEPIQRILSPPSWMLVIGNEAHGSNVPPSFHPQFVTIPMPGPVDSLNAAQAGAILLYSLTHGCCCPT